MEVLTDASDGDDYLCQLDAIVDSSPSNSPHHVPQMGNQLPALSLTTLEDDVTSDGPALHILPSEAIQKQKPIMPKPVCDSEAYILVLRGVLADGVVHPAERHLLDSWAAKHGVDSGAHEMALLQLGWTIEGYQNACAPVQPAPDKELQGTSHYVIRVAGFLLSLNAGYVNALAMSGLYALAVSHVTGTVTKSALGLGDVQTQVQVIVAFGVGSIACGLMIGKNQVTMPYRKHCIPS